MKNNKFNVVLKGFIYLFIGCNAISFLINATVMSHIAMLLAMVYNLAIIAILLDLLKIKRKSLYQFGILQLCYAILQTLLLNKPIEENLFVAVGICLIMAAMLCLRKDGVSAWQLLLKEDEQALETEQNSSFESKDSIIGDTQIPKVKNEASAYKSEEPHKGNTIKEDSTNNTKESSPIDEVKNTPLSALPYKEDGSIDFENMTIVQQFTYTSETESVEVALIDLEANINALEKSIEKTKNEINSSHMVNRAMMRDSLRKEQTKLEELYELRSKYAPKKNENSKSGLSVLGWLAIILFAICLLSYLYQKLH